MFAPFSLSAVLPALRAGEMLLMACGASKDQGGAERLAAVIRPEALPMNGLPLERCWGRKTGRY